MKYTIIMEGDKVDACDSLQEVSSRIRRWLDFQSEYDPSIDVTFQILSEEDSYNGQ